MENPELFETLVKRLEGICVEYDCPLEDVLFAVTCLGIHVTSLEGKARPTEDDVALNSFWNIMGDNLEAMTATGIRPTRVKA